MTASDQIPLRLCHKRLLLNRTHFVLEVKRILYWLHLLIERRRSSACQQISYAGDIDILIVSGGWAAVG